jgi:hypothetical protein
MLTNPCYKGEWYTAPGVLAKNGPEALIDADTWERVQALRQHHRKRTRRPPTRFLLAGMVYCGECGGTMTARAPQEGMRYYGCNRGLRYGVCPAKHVPAEEVEGAALLLAKELLRDPGAARVYAEQTDRDELPKWQRELKRTEKALQDLGEEEDLARISYRKGVDSLGKYEKNLAEIATGREELEARQEQLSRLIGDRELREALFDRVDQIAQDFAAREEEATFDDWRKLLQKLDLRAVVTADDWGKRAGRRYDVTLEWAGEAFVRGEVPLASLQAVS